MLILTGNVKSVEESLNLNVFNIIVMIEKNNMKHTYARCPHVDSGFAGKSNEEAIILDNLKMIFPENEYEILYGTRENYKLLNPF